MLENARRLGSLVLLLAACDPGTSDDVDAGVVVDAGGRRDSGPRIDAGPPAPPVAEPGRHDVTVVETRRVVPDGIPDSIDVLHSNNNLDVARLDDRVYLAWRTSPDHFAGPETVIHVVSSTDEVTWEDEASFTLGTDLREPRFLVLGAQIFLYVSVLGTMRNDFAPQGVRVTTRGADGTWSTLEPVAGLERHIAWRTRVEGGVPYMIAYLGGEMIYDFVEDPQIHVDLLTTTDGRAWTPVNDERRSVYVGGGSEADFAFDGEGSFHGIIRLEAGDATGFGSRVCHGASADPSDWECVTDPKKYDSPLVFFHDGETYMIARRNVTATGNYDLGGTGSITKRAVDNQIEYVGAHKRCALWRFVPGEDRIAYLLDLPSYGDTCFPAWIAGESADEVVIYDYSSDVEGEDVSWGAGQRGNTYVYRHVLRFTPR